MLSEELEALKTEIRNCNKCNLRDNTEISCWDNGDYSSGLVFIGEAPGTNEAQQGIPFIGKAGQYLNRCLLAIGIERNNVFITNTCMCRPVEKSTNKDRAPTVEEIEVCSSYLVRQLELIKPKIIVSLGRTSFQFLTGSSDAMLKAKSNLYSYKFNTDIKVFPLMHPSYILSYGSQKLIEDNWNDWLKLKEILIEFNIRYNQ